MLGSWHLEVSEQNSIFEASQDGISSPGQIEDKEQDTILEKEVSKITYTLNILLKLSRHKCVLYKNVEKAREMTKGLRALGAPPEDPSLFPKTHVIT